MKNLRHQINILSFFFRSKGREDQISFNKLMGTCREFHIWLTGSLSTSDLFFFMKQGFITKELRHRKEFSFSRGNSEIYFRDCTRKWNQCFGSTNEQLCFCCVYVYAYVERVTNVVKAAQDE